MHHKSSIGDVKPGIETLFSTDPTNLGTFTVRDSQNSPRFQHADGCDRYTAADQKQVNYNYKQMFMTGEEQYAKRTAGFYNHADPYVLAEENGNPFGDNSPNSGGGNEFSVVASYNKNDFSGLGGGAFHFNEQRHAPRGGDAAAASYGANRNTFAFSTGRSPDQRSGMGMAAVAANPVDEMGGCNYNGDVEDVLRTLSAFSQQVGNEANFPAAPMYPMQQTPSYSSGGANSQHTNSPTSRNPYTYRGPNMDHTNRSKRLHQDFKALTKEERQRLVEQEATQSDLLQRTVHLRFLPTCMKQSELADILKSCGEYLRVRICGNATNNQNWIYGFVEFATKEGADKMMQCCGMELFNGRGRPSLRLKCNAAKQPIVDRVFHDADQADNTPCIFGLGNFANRTLKDALDSYFNLKAKEASSGVGVNSNGNNNNTVAPARNTFNPSAAAFVPTPASDHATAMNFLSSNTGNTIRNVGANGEGKQGSSDSGDSATAGITPRPSRSSTMVQELGVTPPSFTDSNAAAAQYAPVPTSGSTNSSTTSNTNNNNNNNNSNNNNARAAALGDELTLALQQMMAQHHTEDDGEEVTARATRLLCTALGYAKQFASGSGPSGAFYDCVGTLCSLEDLLDRHEPITGGPASCGAGDFTAGLPQRVTQLRLCCHMLRSLLSLLRRQPSEALPSIHSAVTICNSVPQRPLQAPNSGNVSDRLSDASSTDSQGRVVPVGLTVGDGLHSGAAAAHGFSIWDTTTDAFREVTAGSPAAEELPAQEVKEAHYQRDVAFHRYLIQVLVTLGLALEEVQPVLARSAFSVAAVRAREVLGHPCEVLETLLSSGAAPAKLMDALFAKERAGQNTKDITFFPKLFFERMDCARLTEESAEAEEGQSLFWAHLPPYPCVQLFE